MWCINIAMTSNNARSKRKQRLTARGRALVLITNARARAVRTGAVVTIDADWIAHRIERGTCALTGLAFCLDASQAHRAHPFAPSLDRIDNSNRDYTPENTRVVLHSVNSALNEYGVQHLLMLCDAIRAHTGDGVAVDL